MRAIGVIDATGQPPLPQGPFTQASGISQANRQGSGATVYDPSPHVSQIPPQPYWANLLAASWMNCWDCSTGSAWARRCSYITAYFCTSGAFSRYRSLVTPSR